MIDRFSRYRGKGLLLDEIRKRKIAAEALLEAESLSAVMIDALQAFGSLNTSSIAG